MTNNNASETVKLSWLTKRRVIWSLIATLIAGGIVLAIDQKYRFIAKRWGIVEPNSIYRSGQISKWMIGKTLKQYNIDVIVDLTTPDPADEDHRAEVDAVRELGIEVVQLPLNGDGTGDIRNYAQAVKTLVDCQKQKRRVLVHCAAGAQRTGGVVAAYRLLVQHQPSNVVLNEMERYDWDSQNGAPLLAYLNQHLGQLARLLVENGTLEKEPDTIPVLRP